MKRSIGILGIGWVGSSIAISILQSGIADELLLFDTNTRIAEGEAMDLSHGASFYSAAEVKMATINEILHADVIVISAGRAGDADESRLNLLHENAKIIQSIGQMLTGYKGIVVVVTNPVDILTKILTEISKLPSHRVLGSGTILDTARLKQSLGKLLNIDPHSVHAQVIGEHGDSEVILWSSIKIGGVQLKDLRGWDSNWQSKVDEEVRYAAYKIIQRKGATNHAVGLATAHLLKSILRDERRVLTVSKVQDNINELHGVALSLPTIIGSKGAVEVLMPNMNNVEKDQLINSANILFKVAKKIEDS
ncbi:MAG: L-lactate dehydrogenase [Methylotenera sp.]|nr:MAG: L-lactate dehydrogenase [Methylotenera sp.]PPD54240.1 MAG: L-lactate dehydrogenase [Methylotenera sp.]